MFTENQMSMLDNTLNPTVVQKPAPGKYGDYIEAWWAIHEANRIFGPGNWARETVEMRCVEDAPTTYGRNNDKDGFAVSYVAKVRVTVWAEDGSRSTSGS